MAFKGYWTVLLLLATSYLSFAINSNSTDIDSTTGEDLNNIYQLRIATIFDKSFVKNYENKKKAKLALEKVLEKVNKYFSNGEFIAKLRVIETIQAIKKDMSKITSKVEKKIVIRTLCKFNGNEDIYLFVRGNNKMNIGTEVEKGVICDPLRTKRTIVVTITKDMTDEYAAVLISRFIGQILGMDLDYVMKEGKVQERTHFLHVDCYESKDQRMIVGDCLKSNGIMGDWLLKNSVSNVVGFSQCSRADWNRVYVEYQTFCLKPDFSQPVKTWGGRCRNTLWNKCRLTIFYAPTRLAKFCGNPRNKIRCPRTCGACTEDESISVCENYYFDDTCEWLAKTYTCAKGGDVHRYCTLKCMSC